jgi:hypothetical protein
MIFVYDGSECVEQLFDSCLRFGQLSTRSLELLAKVFVFGLEILDIRKVFGKLHFRLPPFGEVVAVVAQKVVAI